MCFRGKSLGTRPGCHGSGVGDGVGLGVTQRRGAEGAEGRGGHRAGIGALPTWTLTLFGWDSVTGGGRCRTRTHTHNNTAGSPGVEPATFVQFLCASLRPLRLCVASHQAPVEPSPPATPPCHLTPPASRHRRTSDSQTLEVPTTRRSRVASQDVGGVVRAHASGSSTRRADARDHHAAGEPECGGEPGGGDEPGDGRVCAAVGAWPEDLGRAGAVRFGVARRRQREHGPHRLEPVHRGRHAAAGGALRPPHHPDGWGVDRDGEPRGQRVGQLQLQPSRGCGAVPRHAHGGGARGDAALHAGPHE